MRRLIRLIRRIRCRLGRHDWELHEIPVGGVLTIVPRCRYCPRVDVDGIRQAAWNRAARRRWSRIARVRRRLA